MECAWPLSPILMLFGSAVVVVLIKTSNTKLKVIEVLMEEKNRNSRFFILFPPLSLLLFLVLYVFFSTSFSYVFFFIPSPSLLLHLFLFLCLLPPPFPVLYTLYFLDVFVNVPLSFQVFLPSQSPSHLCLWIFLLSFSLSLSSPVSSDLLYHPIVRGWILSRFTLYLSREGSLFLFPYRLNHKFREPLSQYTSVTITRYFSKF